jgi:hypothetical protein
MQKPTILVVSKLVTFWSELSLLGWKSLSKMCYCSKLSLYIPPTLLFQVVSRSLRSLVPPAVGAPWSYGSFGCFLLILPRVWAEPMIGNTTPVLRYPHPSNCFIFFWKVYFTYKENSEYNKSYRTVYNTE